MGFTWKFGFWFSSWASIILVGLFSPRIVEFGSGRFLIMGMGVFLIFYGLILNAIGGRTLKKYGHFEIRKGIKKPERLVDMRIYSCMRYPAQFGPIFFGIGRWEYSQSVRAVLILGVVILIVWGFRNLPGRQHPY